MGASRANGKRARQDRPCFDAPSVDNPLGGPIRSRKGHASRARQPPARHPTQMGVQSSNSPYRKMKAASLSTRIRTSCLKSSVAQPSDLDKTWCKSCGNLKSRSRRPGAARRRGFGPISTHLSSVFPCESGLAAHHGTCRMHEVGIVSANSGRARAYDTGSTWVCVPKNDLSVGRGAMKRFLGRPGGEETPCEKRSPKQRSNVW